MEKIRNSGCFVFSQVCGVLQSRCPCGGLFKSQRADVADRDEWVEECGDKKKWEEDVRDKDERELRERENICITNPVCCYAGGKSPREAKLMFAIICVRLRRQHLNQVLIDNLIILSLRIPGLFGHMLFLSSQPNIWLLTAGKSLPRMMCWESLRYWDWDLADIGIRNIDIKEQDNIGGKKSTARYLWGDFGNFWLRTLSACFAKENIDPHVACLMLSTNVYSKYTSSSSSSCAELIYMRQCKCFYQNQRDL